MTNDFVQVVQLLMKPSLRCFSVTVCNTSWIQSSYQIARATMSTQLATRKTEFIRRLLTFVSQLTEHTFAFFLRTSAHCSLQHVHDMISFVFHSVRLLPTAAVVFLCFPTPLLALCASIPFDAFRDLILLNFGSGSYWVIPRCRKWGRTIVHSSSKSSPKLAVSQVRFFHRPGARKERFRISRILRDPVTRDTVNWGCCCCQTRSLLKQTL